MRPPTRPAWAGDSSVRASMPHAPNEDGRTGGWEAGRPGGREVGWEDGSPGRGREVERQGGREVGKLGRLGGREAGGREAGRPASWEAGRSGVGDHPPGRTGGWKDGRAGGRATAAVLLRLVEQVDDFVLVVVVVQGPRLGKGPTAETRRAEGIHTRARGGQGWSVTSFSSTVGSHEPHHTHQGARPNGKGPRRKHPQRRFQYGTIQLN